MTVYEWRNTPASELIVRCVVQKREISERFISNRHRHLCTSPILKTPASRGKKTKNRDFFCWVNLLGIAKAVAEFGITVYNPLYSENWCLTSSFPLVNVAEKPENIHNPINTARRSPRKTDPYTAVKQPHTDIVLSLGAMGIQITSGV